MNTKNISNTTSCCTPAKKTVRPETNVREVEGGIVLEIDLPGVTKENLSLNVESGLLSLEACRPTIKNEGWSLVSNGPAPEHYTLKLQLNKTLESSTIKANFRNGVLILDILKKESEKPRSIKISA